MYTCRDRKKIKAGKHLALAQSLHIIGKVLFHDISTLLYYYDNKESCLPCKAWRGHNVWTRGGRTRARPLTLLGQGLIKINNVSTNLNDPSHTGCLDPEKILSTIDTPPGVPGVSKNNFFFFHKWNYFPFALRLPLKDTNFKKPSKLKKKWFTFDITDAQKYSYLS